MPQDVRIWEIQAGDHLAEFIPSKLDLEQRIETWLERDITTLSDDLLVIGRQVTTSFGGVIDLLCLDSSGDTVIVELKRDKTPRDITAQVLDYATWVQDLSGARIAEMADQYLGVQGPLDQAFERRFDEELPESLNSHHRMLIVASGVDASTERIITYLSDTHGVDINAISFQYFRDSDRREFLARVFLIEPSQVEYSTQVKSTSKRRQLPSYTDFREIARDNGVGDAYALAFAQLKQVFNSYSRTQSSIFFIGEMDESRNTIFSLYPGYSSVEKGLHFRVFIDRLARYFGTDKEVLLAALPPGTKKYEPWNGAPECVAGYFRTEDEVRRLSTALHQLRDGR